MLDRPSDSAMSPTAAASASPDGLPGGTADLLILIGRILVGQLFVVSGWGKLFAMSAFGAGLVKNGVPEGMAGVLSVVAPCVEFFGGIAIVLGVAIRWTAPLMLLFTIIAAFVGHRYWEAAEAARRGQEVNFYKNVTIIGGFLFLIVTGGGRFSIDGLLRRNR
jgi:putative oxidoreductase